MISEATMNDLPSSVFIRPAPARPASRGKAVLPPSALFRGSPLAPRRGVSHVSLVIAVGLALGLGGFVGFTVSRGLQEEAQGRGPAGVVLKAAVPQAPPSALPRPPATQAPPPAPPPKTAAKHRIRTRKAHHSKGHRHHHSPCARFQGVRMRMCHTIFR
ncbi:hypothetical protein GCM10010176_063400 [Nonomuraea spiralis]|nr:hypothetical protein GCM10010176_063400 [Nonomuraea spiralis]